MAGTPIGTPDWQRGVVDASKLLATVAAGTDSQVVGIPPNAKTLVVCFSHGDTPVSIEVVGDTTGIVYPGAPIPSLNIASTDVQYAFPVSSSLDDQVTVNLTGTISYSWYVYAHSGTSVVTDANLATPPVPTESVLKVAMSGTSVSVLAAPTTGANYLFGCEVFGEVANDGGLTLYTPTKTITVVGIAGAGVTTSINLERMRVTDEVLADNASAASNYLTLRYAPGA